MPTPRALPPDVYELLSRVLPALIGNPLGEACINEVRALIAGHEDAVDAGLVQNPTQAMVDSLRAAGFFVRDDRNAPAEPPRRGVEDIAEMLASREREVEKLRGQLRVLGGNITAARLRFGARADENLEDFLQRVVTEGQTARADLVHAKAEVERRDVQLAGCLAAAEGATSEGQVAKQGDYGWSLAYQRTLDLRAERDRLRGLLGRSRCWLRDVCETATDALVAEIDAALTPPAPPDALCDCRDEGCPDCDNQRAAEASHGPPDAADGRPRRPARVPSTLPPCLADACRVLKDLNCFEAAGYVQAAIDEFFPIGATVRTESTAVQFSSSTDTPATAQRRPGVNDAEASHGPPDAADERPPVGSRWEDPNSGDVWRVNGHSPSKYGRTFWSWVRERDSLSMGGKGTAKQLERDGWRRTDAPATAQPPDCMTCGKTALYPGATGCATHATVDEAMAHEPTKQRMVAETNALIERLSAERDARKADAPATAQRRPGVGDEVEVGADWVPARVTYVSGSEWFTVDAFPDETFDVDQSNGPLWRWPAPEAAASRRRPGVGDEVEVNAGGEWERQRVVKADGDLFVTDAGFERRLVSPGWRWPKSTEHVCIDRCESWGCHPSWATRPTPEAAPPPGGAGELQDCRYVFPGSGLRCRLTGVEHRSPTGHAYLPPPAPPPPSQPRMSDADVAPWVCRAHEKCDGTRPSCAITPASAQPRMSDADVGRVLREVADCKPNGPDSFEERLRARADELAKGEPCVGCGGKRTVQYPEPPGVDYPCPMCQPASAGELAGPAKDGVE